MFVIYNWTQASLDHLEFCINPAFAKYIIVGEELCPTTGTPHLQGFIQCHNKMSLPAIRNKVSATGRGEFRAPVNWSFAPYTNQNIPAMVLYCKGLVESKQTPDLKDTPENWIPNTYHEYGYAPPGQGKRSDLEAAITLIQNGSSLEDLATICPTQFVKFSTGLMKLRFTLQSSRGRTWPTEVIWLWGPTGSGKSLFAAQNTDKPYYKNSSTKWWCGYDGHAEVIIDDFRPCKEMPFNYILQLFDRYPMQVESKGGNHQFLARRIIVTTPRSVDETLLGLEWVGLEQRAQLKRRISRELQFPNPEGNQYLPLLPLNVDQTVNIATPTQTSNGEYGMDTETLNLTQTCSTTTQSTISSTNCDSVECVEYLPTYDAVVGIP